MRHPELRAKVKRYRRPRSAEFPVFSRIVPGSFKAPTKHFGRNMKTLLFCCRRRGADRGAGAMATTRAGAVSAVPNGRASHALKRASDFVHKPAGALSDS